MKRRLQVKESVNVYSQNSLIRTSLSKEGVIEFPTIKGVEYRVEVIRWATAGGNYLLVKPILYIGMGFFLMLKWFNIKKSGILSIFKQ